MQSYDLFFQRICYYQLLLLLLLLLLHFFHIFPSYCDLWRLWLLLARKCYCLASYFVEMIIASQYWDQVDLVLLRSLEFEYFRLLYLCLAMHEQSFVLVINNSFGNNRFLLSIIKTQTFCKDHGVEVVQLIESWLLQYVSNNCAIAAYYLMIVVVQCCYQYSPDQ